MIDPVDLIDTQNEMKVHSWLEFTLWPRMWATYPNSTSLCWICHKLDRSRRHLIPGRPGVYTLLIQPGIAEHPYCSYLFYVGKAVSLRRRFGEYLGKERTNPRRAYMYRALNMYSNNIWFCMAEVESSQLDIVEDALKQAYMPPLNHDVPADVRPIVRAFR